MRYAIVDLDGASRDYFSVRQDAHEALAEAELEHPGSARELFVVKYDDATGEQIGEPERGDEVLASHVLDTSATISFADGTVAFGGMSSKALVERVVLQPKQTLVHPAQHRASAQRTA